jgi:BMFP domain-containing protein YqiC
MTMLSWCKFAKVALRGRFIMKFDEFYQQLTDQLNQVTTGSDGISQEAAVYLRAATSNLFKKLDIVSKEEFEAQKAVLARSREKINQLEQQLEQLKQLMDSAK